MYQIVHDPEQVKQFFTVFTPQRRDYAIVFQLFARRKYNELIPQQTQVLNRTIISGGTPEVESLQHVLRLEVREGLYNVKDVPVPGDSLALYCLIQPKDMLMAMTKTVTDCVSNIQTGFLRSPFKMYREEIGKTSVQGETRLLQIDLDSKDEVIVKEVQELLKAAGVRPVMAIETRGGFHIVYKKESHINSKMLWEYSNKHKVEVTRRTGTTERVNLFTITHEPSVIIPGTIQGGFKTRIVDF